MVMPMLYFTSYFALNFALKQEIKLRAFLPGDILGADWMGYPDPDSGYCTVCVLVEKMGPQNEVREVIKIIVVLGHSFNMKG